jgi:hypothetical protein
MSPGVVMKLQIPLAGLLAIFIPSIVLAMLGVR